MDELVKLVAKKAGITPDQAKKAVTTVLGFLKGKLPPAVGGQLDAVLAGKAPDVSGALSGLGGILGKKK